MNIRLSICFLFFIFCSPSAFAQKVNDKFDRLTLSENFDSSSSHWMMVANNDNLFIVQDGEYILNRKTTVSPFAIISNYDFEISSFRMVTSLKLEKTQDDEGSIGLLFMAQAGGKGGFVLEFNKKKEFRLRQITGGAYNYLTGDQKSGGWTKSPLLSDLNLYNLVEVKSSNNNYDISVNNTLLMSFSESSYKSGKFGLIVGPGSKGRVDFLYLFSQMTPNEVAEAGVQDNTNSETNTAANSKKDNSDADLIVLTESIIKLKTQINKLTEQNEDLKRTIEAMKSDDQDVENQKKASEKQMKQMQLQVDKTQASYDSLLVINKQLLKYKEMVAGSENSDLIITLSQNLKTEKANNEQLRKKNKELTDALAAKPDSLKNKGQGKSSANLNKQSTDEPADTIRKQDEFVLPKN